ncbi:MAG: biopolymer transporter ExbD [candidate division NC10 bacterium]|nr:biopolymer transporter ExbD [candidate division NC10 bacterium]
MNYSDRRGGSALSEINITPFVDVVLVLLIIFLITAPMLIRGIDVNVPRSQSKNIEPEERLVIAITRNQVIYLDDQPIELPRLEKVLAGLRGRNPSASIYIKADRDVPYGAVIQVMDAAKKAGIDKLGMVTEPISAASP